MLDIKRIRPNPVAPPGITQIFGRDGIGNSRSQPRGRMGANVHHPGGFRWSCRDGGMGDRVKADPTTSFTPLIGFLEGLKKMGSSPAGIRPSL